MTENTDRTPAAADARFAEMGGDESKVPQGSYCYTIDKIETDEDGQTRIRTVPCPYWGVDRSKDAQDCGYCALLKAGDWEEDGTMFLWDQVKECGINHKDSIDDDFDYLLEDDDDPKTHDKNAPGEEKHLAPLYRAMRVFFIALLGSLSTLVAMHARLALKEHRPPDSAQWVEIAREIPLVPCFSSPSEVMLWSKMIETNTRATDEQKAQMYPAEQIIPDGVNKGFVVPKHCFAVQRGYFGWATDYWKRPRVNNKVDYTIPYWNPIDRTDG